MRIAISQRVNYIAAYAERRDCLDQQWAALLERLGHLPVPIPNGLNDPTAWATNLQIEAFLLTGGNDLEPAGDSSTSAPERNRCERLILEHASAHRLPVLGVCRGSQMINSFLGGSIVPVPGHVASRHQLTRTTEPARLLKSLPSQTEVNSFHNFGVDARGLAASLIPLMVDRQGFVEAAEHRNLPWAQIMWHPEREAWPSALDISIFNDIFKPDGQSPDPCGR